VIQQREGGRGERGGTCVIVVVGERGDGSGVYVVGVVGKNAAEDDGRQSSHKGEGENGGQGLHRLAFESSVSWMQWWLSGLRGFG
jgi:hypothetical protein